MIFYPVKIGKRLDVYKTWCEIQEKVKEYEEAKYNEEKNNSEVSKNVRIFCSIFIGFCLLFFVVAFIIITLKWGTDEANVSNSLISTVICVLLVGLFDIIDYFMKNGEVDEKSQFENEKFKTLTKGIMMFIGSILPIVYGVFSFGPSFGVKFNIIILILLIVSTIILNKRK